MPTITPAVGRVSSGWGKRKSKIPGMTTFHRGVDIAAAAGTPIVAPEDGIVTVSTYNVIRGHYVIVNHGRFQTLAQHMSKRLVTVGQGVPRGHTIGLMGRTGNVTGVHLHAEVHDRGTPIDPAPWYRERGVTLGVASAAEHVTPTPAPVPAPSPAPTATATEDDMIQLIERTYRELCDREGSIDDVAGWFDATRAAGGRAFLAAFRASPAEPGTIRAAWRMYLHEPSADEVALQMAQGYTIARAFDVAKAARANGQR